MDHVQNPASGWDATSLQGKRLSHLSIHRHYSTKYLMQVLTGLTAIGSTSDYLLLSSAQKLLTRPFLPEGEEAVWLCKTRWK